MTLEDTFDQSFPVPDATFPKLVVPNPNPIVRPLVEIYPPSEVLCSEPPKLPPRLTTDDLKPLADLGFVYTRHLVPACHLRMPKPATFPPYAPPNAAKEEKTKAYKAIMDQVLQLRDQHNRIVSSWKPGDAPLKGYEKLLWHCVSRFVNLHVDDPKTGITLFLSPPNGFPKETLELLIKHIFLSTPGLKERVAEIWCFEPVIQGDSALINAEVLDTAGVTDWSDLARDMLNFFWNFVPQTASQEELPTQLQRNPKHVAEMRKSKGFGGTRTLVAIGPSWAGTNLGIAADYCPALFSSIVLLDPMLVPPGTLSSTDPIIVNWLRVTVARRSSWANRDLALQFFQRSPFFRSWDPESLVSYVTHGLYSPSPSSPEVHLKQSPIHESTLTTEFYTGSISWYLLSKLDERIPLLWIMPGKGQELKNGVVETAYRVWVRRQNSENVRIDGAGHLITLESPKRAGEVIGAFLSRTYVITAGAKL